MTELENSYLFLFLSFFNFEFRLLPALNNLKKNPFIMVLHIKHHKLTLKGKHSMVLKVFSYWFYDKSFYHFNFCCFRKAIPPVRTFLLFNFFFSSKIPVSNSYFNLNIIFLSFLNTIRATRHLLFAPLG